MSIFICLLVYFVLQDVLRWRVIVILCVNMTVLVYCHMSVNPLAPEFSFKF
jgi:cytochrome c oxidase subunit IV